MHRLALLPALAVLLLVAAACGEQGAEGDATGSATQASPTESPQAGADDGAAEATPTAAEASDSCAELEGTTIRFVVPYDAGGGYDQYARFLAPALEERTGATIIVENQPGAGGLLAINSLLNAPTDGSRIAIMNAVGSGGAAIADAEGVQFELDQLSYIGRVTDDRPVVVVAPDSEYQSFDDLLAADSLRVGSNGPGSQDFITTTVLNAIFEDLNGEIITGFDGSEEIALTLLQGQIDFMSGSLSSRLPSIENGDERPLLLMARQPSEELPDTPAILERDLDERQQELAEAFLSLLELGRAIVGPPDMAEEPLDCLRTAMGEAFSDPALLEESEKQERPLSYMSGEELDQLVANLSSAPQEFQQVITEAH